MDTRARPSMKRSAVDLEAENDTSRLNSPACAVREMVPIIRVLNIHVLCRCERAFEISRRLEGVWVRVSALFALDRPKVG